MYTINVGLMTSERADGGRVPIPYGIAKRAVWRRAAVPKVHFKLVTEGVEEPTLVAVIPGRMGWDQMMGLAFDLQQDCVAVLDYDGKGYLVGPRAKEWGEFNPAYFHTM